MGTEYFEKLYLTISVSVHFSPEQGIPSVAIWRFCNASNLACSASAFARSLATAASYWFSTNVRLFCSSFRVISARRASGERNQGIGESAEKLAFAFALADFAGSGASEVPPAWH